MNILSFHELRSKEIVNVSDGSKFGGVSDVLIDVERGEVEAIVVGKMVRSGFLGFLKEDKRKIPWEQIRNVGEDIILVEIEIE